MVAGEREAARLGDVEPGVGSLTGVENGTVTPPTASTSVLKAQKSTWTKWSVGMPKFWKIVSINCCGLSRWYAALMRCWLDRPAIVTHRSRGNDRTATCEVAGSTRHTMIVSLRSPRLDRSPNAPAYGESGSTQAVVVGAGDQEVLGPGFGRRERRRAGSSPVRFPSARTRWVRAPPGRWSRWTDR